MIFDVKPIYNSIKQNLKDVIVRNNLNPSLTIISTLDDFASEKYVKNKIKIGTELGIDVQYYKFKNSKTDEIKDFIKNCDTDGIIVQLPVRSDINEVELIESIPPEKDVDCFTSKNIYNIFTSGDSSLRPCTPDAVVQIIDKFLPTTNKGKFEGKQITILSRSNLIGKPLALMLTSLGATVTICNSHTKDTWSICNLSDVVITAMGKPGVIDERYFKVDSLWIDVSINRSSDGSVCGDIDKNLYDNKYCYITSVPGGVGPMTVLSLMRNTVIAHYIRNNVDILEIMFEQALEVS